MADMEAALARRDGRSRPEPPTAGDIDHLFMRPPSDVAAARARSERYVAVRADKEHAADERSVYFIQGERGGRIKIGVTQDVTKRIAKIQLMSPERLLVLGVIPYGGELLERALHGLFAAERSHGEWFDPTDELIEFIRLLQSQIATPPASDTPAE